VPGKFGDYTIDFMFDEKDLSKSSVKATIKTASINTDNKQRDEHLRSADFFDAEKYPEITFVSDEIKKKGGQYVAKGTLTIRGVSKEIELPFIILGPVQDSRGNTRIGVEASLTIDRQEYGVSWSKTLDTGSLVVSDEVNIKLDVELQKEG
ncbi:MAG: YceI family protein, partial [Candidatus Hodarchaeota archaeon]